MWLYAQLSSSADAPKSCKAAEQFVEYDNLGYATYSALLFTTLDLFRANTVTTDEKKSYTKLT